MMVDRRARDRKDHGEGKIRVGANRNKAIYPQLVGVSPPMADGRQGEDCPALRLRCFEVGARPFHAHELALTSQSDVAAPRTEGRKLGVPKDKLSQRRGGELAVFLLSRVFITRLVSRIFLDKNKEYYPFYPRKLAILKTTLSKSIR